MAGVLGRAGPGADLPWLGRVLLGRPASGIAVLQNAVLTSCVLTFEI